MPTKYTFHRCIDCVDIASRSSARGRQTTLRWQKQVFIHTQLSRTYLALARLSCLFIAYKRFYSCQVFTFSFLYFSGTFFYIYARIIILPCHCVLYFIREDVSVGRRSTILVICVEYNVVVETRNMTLFKVVDSKSDVM